MGLTDNNIENEGAESLSELLINTGLNQLKFDEHHMKISPQHNLFSFPPPNSFDLIIPNKDTQSTYSIHTKK